MLSIRIKGAKERLWSMPEAGFCSCQSAAKVSRETRIIACRKRPYEASAKEVTISAITMNDR